MTTTLFSTTCEPGAVVYVNFRFAGQAGTKPRPVVVLSVNDYHASRIDAVILALTTKMDDSYFGDCELEDWQSANLPKPSKAKGVIQTIEQRSIRNRLGTLSANDYNRIKAALRDIFGMDDA